MQEKREKFNGKNQDLTERERSLSPRLLSWLPWGCRWQPLMVLSHGPLQQAALLGRFLLPSGHGWPRQKHGGKTRTRAVPGSGWVWITITTE